MQNEITTQLEFDEVIKSKYAAAFYMSTPDCNVCKVLKPRMKEFLADKYPEIKFIYVNIAEAKELAAQKSVFTVPTILFYFDGKEYIRKARIINFDELELEIERYYRLM